MIVCGAHPCRGGLEKLKIALPADVSHTCYRAKYGAMHPLTGILHITTPGLLCTRLHFSVREMAGEIA